VTPAELAEIQARADTGYVPGESITWFADRAAADRKKLLTALRSADVVPRGLYRNPGGFELRVGFAASEQTAGIRTIAGDIAVATSYDPMFGTWTYLVTAASLRECGYELVEPEASDA